MLLVLQLNFSFNGYNRSAGILEYKVSMFGADMTCWILHTLVLFRPSLPDRIVSSPGSPLARFPNVFSAIPPAPSNFYYFIYLLEIPEPEELSLLIMLRGLKVFDQRFLIIITTHLIRLIQTAIDQNFFFTYKWSPKHFKHSFFLNHENLTKTIYRIQGIT